MFLYAFLKKYILINYGSFSGDQLRAALAEAIQGSEHYPKTSISLGKQNS